MSLGVVILNWNNGPDTVSCVRMVQDWSDPSVVVWVVDNASEDGSADAIARECVGVSLIRSETNRGFGGGTNLGIKAALSAGCETVLLLNNDASIDAANLDRLRETLFAETCVGVVGPLIRDRECPERIVSAGGRDISRHLVSHWSQPPNDRAVYRVHYVPGTVALIRGDLLRRVGSLDEDYFFGVEMVDLCERARVDGFSSVIDAQSVAYHSVARSSQARECLHVYYVVRNRLLYIRKANNDRVVRSALFLIVWSLYSLGLALSALARGNRSRSRAIWLALRHACSGTVGGQNELVLSIEGSE